MVKLKNPFKCNHPDDYIHSPAEIRMCDAMNWRKVSFIRTGIKQTYIIYQHSMIYACGSNKNGEVRDSKNKVEYELGLMFKKFAILDVLPHQKGVIIQTQIERPHNTP